MFCMCCLACLCVSRTKSAHFDCEDQCAVLLVTNRSHCCTVKLLRNVPRQRWRRLGRQRNIFLRKISN